MAYGYVTPTGGFTVEIWFKHSTLPTWNEAIINQQTQNKASAWSTSPNFNGRQFLIYFLVPTGELRVDWRSEAGTSLLLWTDDTTAYANDNEWHFLCLRMGADMKTWNLWIDGDKKTTTTALATAIDWKPGVMSFGGSYTAALGNFGDLLYNGSLAYFAAWDTALSDSRILEHYTAGNGGTVFYGDDEVKRLGRILDYCNVPYDTRRFDDPVTTLQGIQIAGENGLSKALETATDATGLVFADGQSVMTYHNRRHRYNRAILKTLSEDSASAPDVGMEFATDDTKVYNDIRASRPFGGSARIRNKSSEYEYGRRVFDLKIAVTSDDEMRNAGTWLAERYGEDRVRISGVTLSAESSDEIEELVATVQIGDCVAFDDLPDNAPFTYAEFIVEGISVEANFKDQTWSLGLELSPAELWNVLQVGVSTLGDGSRIAY
jgi:hypothetical protein